MKTVILRENEPYSIEYLSRLFQCSNEQVIQYLKSLGLMNIVKHINKTWNIDLNDFLDVDSIDSDTLNLEKGVYLFTYVGMFLIDGACIIVYPKYLKNYRKDKYNGYKDLKQIVEVIIKYQANKQDFGGDTNDGKEYFNILSLTLDLFDNYYKYGLYRNEMDISEINGYGQVLWNRTMNYSIPYIKENRPIYFDYYTSKKVNNFDDFFHRLHACLLTEISDNLNDILLILEVEPLKLSNEKLDDFGDVDHIIQLINQELSQQFVTSRHNTLKLIKSYFEKSYTYNQSDVVSLVGTGSFHNIWEEACSVVLNNNFDDTLIDLKLTYKKTHYSTKISKIVEQPKWYYSRDEAPHLANKTLIPDIISINNEEKTFSIYDAKYYQIILNDEQVAKQPGIADITKQYLYELAYKEFMVENKLSMKENAFLMPTDEDEKKIIGYVSLDMFRALDEIKSKSIKIILLPTRKIYADYLRST